MVAHSENWVFLRLLGSVFDSCRLGGEVVPGKLRNAGVRYRNALRAFFVSFHSTCVWG